MGWPRIMKVLWVFGLKVRVGDEAHFGYRLRVKKEGGLNAIFCQRDGSRQRRITLFVD